MSSALKKVTFVPLGDKRAFQDVLFEDENRTMAEALSEAPALTADEPLGEAFLDRRVKHTRFRVVGLADVDADQPLFAILGLAVDAGADAQAAVAPTAVTPTAATPTETEVVGTASEDTTSDEAPTTVSDRHPERLSEDKVVAIAYRAPVRKLATFLRSRLSVLVSCEKLIVPYLWEEIVKAVRLPAAADSPGVEPRLEYVLLQMPEGAADNPLGGGAGAGQLQALRQMISEIKPNQVLVIPNLDLLGGGGEKNLGREARELTELVYGALDCLVLAFVDPSLPVPEVIAARFAVRAEVEGLFRDVPSDDGESIPVGVALVEAGEAALFEGFEAAELYKNVAGLNPIRLRNALAYAVQVARDKGYDEDNKAPVDLLKHEVRAFKAQTSEQFTVPDVGFEDIGGYDDVKHVLDRAIGLMSGLGKLPDEKLRHELIPRGFLFHGPPGTGKTLFAKAIANRLNATIRVVSGPEVTDMYVGESERKMRAIFAEARRNAPSVIVFDEFDSIAGRRSGRDDGGSRAGNALVAQILTEMDGFRPEVQILVIGTTNRLGLIDEALLRPSRFEPVGIGMPDPVARRRIAEIHAEHFKVPVDDDLLNAVANASEGLNGDEIRSIFRDACVGLHCDKIPVDAWRLGYLVGLVRTRLDVEHVETMDSRPRQRPDEGPPGPSGPMTPMVRAKDQATTKSDSNADSNEEASE